MVRGLAGGPSSFYLLDNQQNQLLHHKEPSHMDSSLTTPHSCNFVHERSGHPVVQQSLLIPAAAGIFSISVEAITPPAKWGNRVVCPTQFYGGSPTTALQSISTFPSRRYLNIVHSQHRWPITMATVHLTASVHPLTTEFRYPDEAACKASRHCMLRTKYMQPCVDFPINDLLQQSNHVPISTFMPRACARAFFFQHLSSSAVPSPRLLFNSCNNSGEPRGTQTLESVIRPRIVLPVTYDLRTWRVSRCPGSATVSPISTRFAGSRRRFLSSLPASSWLRFLLSSALRPTDTSLLQCILQTPVMWISTSGLRPGLDGLLKTSTAHASLRIYPLTLSSLRTRRHCKKIHGQQGNSCLVIVPYPNVSVIC